MDQDLSRKLMIEEYHSYAEICRQKSLSIDELTDDQIKALPMIDLGRLVRHVRDLARTPTE